jgi:RHS repeat-associated protein
VTAKTYLYFSSNGLLRNTPSPWTSLDYDAFDRLLFTEYPTTYYVFDAASGGGGTDQIAQYDASNVLQKRWVFDDGGSPLVEYDASGNRTFLETDERGSVIALANDSATVTAINTYDEYGIPAASNAGTFQYTGAMWLSGPALYLNGLRNYGAHLGRFNQSDPMGYGGDGPNLYAYVLNDPVNRTDPLGLIPELPNRGAIGGGTIQDKGKTTVPSCTGTRLCLAYPNGVAQAFNGVGPGGYGGVLGGTWQKTVTATYTDAAGNIVVTAPSYVFVPFAQPLEFAQVEPNFHRGEPNGALHWFTDQLLSGAKTDARNVKERINQCLNGGDINTRQVVLDALRKSGESLLGNSLRNLILAAETGGDELIASSILGGAKGAAESVIQQKCAQ